MHWRSTTYQIIYETAPLSPSLARACVCTYVQNRWHGFGNISHVSHCNRLLPIIQSVCVSNVIRYRWRGKMRSFKTVYIVELQKESKQSGTHTHARTDKTGTKEKTKVKPYGVAGLQHVKSRNIIIEFRWKEMKLASLSVCLYLLLPLPHCMCREKSRKFLDESGETGGGSCDQKRFPNDFQTHQNCIATIHPSHMFS